MAKNSRVPARTSKTGGISIPLSCPTPSAREMADVYALWDELDQFPAEKSDAALCHLAQRLQQLLKAENVKWLAATRILHRAQVKKDPLLGWRLRASYDLVPDPPEYQKLVSWFYQRHGEPTSEVQIGLATHALIAGAGNFRVHRMRDGWIPYRAFRQSEHYDLHYTKLGITDRIWISFPLNADTESIFLIDRHGPTPPFSKRDAAMAGMILRGIREFHRRLFLDRGLFLGETSLSPVLRRIVQKLLTGMSEKEIAVEMEQSLSTTHKYIKTIYSRFGVNGRAALMALWLGPTPKEPAQT